MYGEDVDQSSHITMSRRASGDSDLNTAAGPRKPIPKTRPWTHSLTQPLYSIHTTGNTIFIRHSTMLKIPYFAERIGSGEIKEAGEYDMFGPLDHSASMCLLFDVVEKNTNRDVIDPSLEYSLDVGDHAEDFLRAYPLAGTWRLERIQNWIVDRLIAHYLVYPVPPKDVGILQQLGLAESKLCGLLMRELARGLIDGQRLAQPLDLDTDATKSAVEENLSREVRHNVDDTEKSRQQSHPVTDVVPEIYEDDDNNDKCITNARNQVRSLPIREFSSGTGTDLTDSTNYLINSESSSTDPTEESSPEYASNGIWKQIQKTWTVAGCTNLMAMMIHTHSRNQAPTARSPIELAAAKPCDYHIHNDTDVCRLAEDKSQQRKRKRAVLELDDESETDHQSGSKTEAIDSDEDKENANVKCAKKAESTVRPQPLEKKKRIWDIFTR